MINAVGRKLVALIDDTNDDDVAVDAGWGPCVVSRVTTGQKKWLLDIIYRLCSVTNSVIKVMTFVGLIMFHRCVCAEGRVNG